MDSKHLLFLAKAAALLHNTSPVISRFIALEARNLAYHAKEVISVEGVHNACGTCGTIQILGETCAMRHKRLLCLFCHRSHRPVVPKRPRRAAMLAQQIQVKSDGASEEASNSSSKAANKASERERNAKSKERKKARSMGESKFNMSRLERSTQKKNERSLDLSDFML